VRFATATISAPRESRFPRRQLAHLARAEHQHPPAVELAEHLLCQRRTGRRHRGRRLADRGLDAHLPPGRHGLAEEPVEEGAGGPGLGGRAHLAEDLPLTGTSESKPAGDAEEVQRRRLVAQPVEHALEGRRLVAGEVEQRVARGTVASGVLAGEVDLGAVAGREHHRLARLGERVRERGRTLTVEGHALAQLDRGPVVRDADEREPHDAKWVIGSTTATSTKESTTQRAARTPRRPRSWRSRSRAA
jgi:hypothetical protein